MRFYKKRLIEARAHARAMEREFLHAKKNYQKTRALSDRRLKSEV